MRLRCVETGHDPQETALLGFLRKESGREPVDVVKVLHYRPEIFGRPFSAGLDLAMRGASVWSAGARELFAADGSSLHQCGFLTRAHCAVASHALGEEVGHRRTLLVVTAAAPDGLVGAVQRLGAYVERVLGLDHRMGQRERLGVEVDVVPLRERPSPVEYDRLEVHGGTVAVAAQALAR